MSKDDKATFILLSEAGRDVARVARRAGLSIEELARRVCRGFGCSSPLGRLMHGGILG